MFDTKLRFAKDRWLRAPVARLMRVHPTMITLLGFICGIASAWMAARAAYWWALALFLLGRLLDGLDGAVARAAKKSSALGGYLDIMADFVVYAAIPIALWWSLRGAASPLPLIAMLAVFYVNAASWMWLAAIIEKGDAQTSAAMPTGLIEGFETIVFYCLFIILPAWQAVLFPLFSVLVFISIVQRIVWAIRHLR